jgi:hypothetical protein
MLEAFAAALVGELVALVVALMLVAFAAGVLVGRRM